MERVLEGCGLFCLKTCRDGRSKLERSAQYEEGLAVKLWPAPFVETIALGGLTVTHWHPVTTATVLRTASSTAWEYACCECLPEPLDPLPLEGWWRGGGGRRALLTDQICALALSCLANYKTQ